MSLKLCFVNFGGLLELLDLYGPILYGTNIARRKFHLWYNRNGVLSYGKRRWKPKRKLVMKF